MNDAPSITLFGLQYMRIGPEMLLTRVLGQELSHTSDVPSFLLPMRV